MTARQILAWANVLLKPCALAVRFVRGKHYRLEEKIDIQALISRKNKQGKLYMDKGGLLKQTKPPTYLFMDEGTEQITGSTTRTIHPILDRITSNDKLDYDL